MLYSLRLSNLTRRSPIHPLHLCTSVPRTGDTGRRKIRIPVGRHSWRKWFLCLSELLSPSVRSSSMCSGGWVNESLLGLQPFFGPLSLGLIPLKEMMEGRLVCKCGFYLSRLTLSLSGTPVHGQQAPKTSIGSHRRTTPVPTVHSSGRVLLTWRWGGEGVRAKSLHCVWLSVTL